ncbi:MAG: acylphosphatase [Cyclobacteriaceae bacterium]|jgi:acylphosphatase|nr:acylphosphatase [Cyclobacteriaceae bacterium]
MKRLNIRVEGRVQGVFYRAFVQEVALQLNIRGFVQNEADGSVYIEAEGDDNDLQQLIARCRQGPPRAQVSNLSVEEAPPKQFSYFRISR